MPQRLVCPDNHEWALLDDAAPAEGRPAWVCPVCGNVPDLETQVGWELGWRVVAPVVALYLSLPILVVVGLVAFPPGWHLVRARYFVALVALFLTLFRIGRLWIRREARDLERILPRLGLELADHTPANRTHVLPSFPLARQLPLCGVSRWL